MQSKTPGRFFKNFPSDQVRKNLQGSFAAWIIQINAKLKYRQIRYSHFFFISNNSRKNILYSYQLFYFLYFALFYPGKKVFISLLLSVHLSNVSLRKESTYRKLHKVRHLSYVFFSIRKINPNYIMTNVSQWLWNFWQNI